MKRDFDRIQDILDAIGYINKYTNGRNLFELNELEQAGMIHFLQIIGEASRALSPEFREKNNHINWAHIITFRNIIVHEYLNVDFDIVSRVIIRDIPVLKTQIEKITDIPPV